MSRSNKNNMLNSVSDAIISITDEDIISFWNTGAQNIFGWKESEAIGKKLSALAVPPKWHAEKAKLEHKAKSGKITDGVETKWLAKNGNLVNLTMSLFPSQNEDKTAGVSYIISINDEKPAKEALIESELQMHAIMQQATDAIIFANENGIIISASKVAQNLFQYAEEDIKRKPLTVLIPKRYRASHEIGLQRMISTGKANIIGKKVELFGIKKDGSEFPIRLSLYSWNSGKKIFISAIIGEIKSKKEDLSFETDIIKLLANINRNTSLLLERKEEQESSCIPKITIDASLVKYRKKAEELQFENTRFALANKAESEFLANISRDFRDNLASIIGFGELLQRRIHGELGKKQEQYIDTILYSGKSLIAIIDDFELKRREARKIHLYISMVFVVEIIHETLNILKEKAIRNKVELKKDIAFPFNVMYADKKFLELIFFNLMGNAIDHSPGGSVQITARKENTMANFSIRGSGWGDTPKKIDENCPLPDENNMPEFIITKKLVQMHGGKIFSEKKDGELLITFIMPIEVKKEDVF